ncbi:helix-turn-helix transcriptional regulator [Albidovulum sp.]|jgi:DNA-binding CsgD family transcriptional regulator|uniref:helix-turn-helix transcriptional regulator n=1 Tax=Albidovulum sp. TaxID=1872424 RepID=UPI0039B9A358
MRDRIAVLLLLFLQVLCAAFLTGGTILTLLGINHRPISWEIRELLEVGAMLGLVFGAFLSVIVLTRILKRQKRAEDQLRQVSGAFMELMQTRFRDWGLTSAERDVALFAIKGLSTQEIASLRGTAEGTVKAQTNAIYRKSGVNGRPQLLSLFIEDLMDDEMLPAPAAQVDPDQPDAALRVAG